MSEEAIEKLRKEIEASGEVDKYIDADEEKAIYSKGDTLGLTSKRVESMLNLMCRDGGWTRELDIIDDLLDILRETTSDDGAIDQKEWEHCINYAVAMNMPRKRAMHLGVKFVSENRLKIKKKLLGGDWFKPLKEHYS